MGVRMIEAASDCGLVLQQTGRPAVRGVRVTNEGEQTLGGLSSLVSSDVGCFHPQTLVGGDAKEKSPAEKRIKNWSHRLLDLSRANRLLNVRENAKVVPILCSALPALEDGISSDRLYCVKSYENYLDEDAAAEFRRTERPARLDLYKAALSSALSQGELWSLLGRRETERRLRDLYRAARVDLEESGVNTLFLALGVLEWREKDGADQSYRAPILLLPVRIERRSVADGYRIRRLDEETIVNTTLLELLRRDYALTIPDLDPLPVDESGTDVQKVFGIFRAAIRAIPGLSVHEDCLLGQFSFGKFVMWKDLTARIDAVRANPIVSHLISRDGRYDDGVEIFPREEIDRHLAYAKLCCPLSADSSQLAAVLYSERGKTFVLEGPPGTGKSQTITNIIAHNLSLGRRVLFVSEKKAALDVVYGRLAKLGLAPFCLELHSNKSGKGQIYDQFKSALAQTAKTPVGARADVVKETEALRRELDSYVGALHRQTISGFTAYDLFTRLVRGELTEEASAIYGEARVVTRETYEAAGRDLAAAAEARAGLSAESVRALASVRPFAWSPAAEQRLADEARRLAEEIAAAAQELEGLGGEKGTEAEKVVRYLKLLKTRREFEENLSERYDLARLKALPVREIRRRLSAIDASFVVTRLLRTRALVNELSPVFKEGRLAREDLREALKQANLLQEADEEIGKLEKGVRPLLAVGFESVASDPEGVLLARARAELRLEKARADLKAIADGSETLSTTEAMALARGVALFAKGNLRRAFIYFGVRAKLPDLAQTLARRLDEDDAPDPQAWRSRFEKAFQSKLLNEVLESDPIFGAFLGQNREAAMARFAELDATCARLSLENLIARLSDKISTRDFKACPIAKTELGLLLHECGKKRQQKPIRRMLAEAPQVIADLKPCFLMSPLSVAQYLPVDAPPFDLIVFDEASQIPVWDAIGVIARGRQLIVVGDTKQLPPTNFFRRGADEEEVCEDLESVLDECCHAGILTCSLGWHYRSRHESLIAFSNRRYYDSGLHVFPAAEKSERLGVSFVHVSDGVYEARGSRTNRREAEVVVDRVFEILTGAATADMSVGVVTFSEAQRDLIEDLIDERRLAHPELEARFVADAAEPFFVKNLENVQGDERDAIVFSIGYAPDASGKFNMLFGPLGNRGGERRLNVAITRAREKIVVVSSIHAHQIDTERTNGQGPADLKAFLDYAERGYRISLGATNVAEDGFAAEIAAVLEKAGAQVELNVGCGGVQVDVAVRDPENASRYLMGFVCDGASYARELTARDRDSLRDGVLKSLGWTISHVWITDWALDRERAERNLLSTYNSLRQKKEIRP